MMIPTEYICPITMELMVHPLATRYGHNFEKHAIIAWLDSGSEHCPVTRQPLSYSDLIHNNQLALEIDQWRQRHGQSLVAPIARVDDTVDTYVTDKLTQIYGSGDIRFVVPASTTDPPDSAQSGPHQRVDTSRPVRSLLRLARRKAAVRLV